MSRIGWTVVRAIARFCVWGYYSLFSVQGAARIPAEGPVLLVANHPNALVDSGVLLCAVPRPVAFVAGRSVLTSRVLGRLLRALGLAPVLRLGDDRRDASGRRRGASNRPGDVSNSQGDASNSQGDASSNERLFSVFTAYLRGGGAAVVFPEGHSHHDPELKPIRPGAAGIALDAEADSDFALGLRIVPVGLHFEPRQRFRGEVHVRVGAPFEIRDLQGKPRREAIRAVQERIASGLRPLFVHLERVDLEPLVQGVSRVYDEFQRADAAVMEPRPQGEIVQLASACLNHFLVADPSAVDLAQKRLRRYERLAKRAGIRGAAVETHARPIRSWFGLVLAVVGAVVGLPVYLLGLLTGYVPYRLTDAVAKALTGRRHVAALPRLRIATAAIVFTLFWGLLTLFVWMWSHSLRVTALAVLVFLGTSLFTRFYVEQIRTWWARLQGLRPFRKRGMRRVARARRSLLQLVDDLAVRYREETGARLLPPRRVRWYRKVPWRAAAAVVVTAAGVWFAMGLFDRDLKEIPGRSSPWVSMETDRARKTLDADARALTGLLDTLQQLEAATYSLKARFDAGEGAFTDVEDDRAIRQALLTYLNCRSELFRLAWFYRSPDRLRQDAAGAIAPAAEASDPEAALDDQAFVLGYASAIELVRRGMQLVAVFDDCPNAIRKLNEGDIAWNLPPDTYDRVRRNLSNYAVYDELADAMVRYDRLVARTPRPTRQPWARIYAEADQGRAVIQRLSEQKWKYKWETALARAQGSAEDARYAASSFFAGLVGSVKIREGDLGEGLISDAQVAWLRDEVLEPGDILLERRNWALTNVFLPGFWTHAALYVGGVDGMRALGIEDDERVKPHLAALAEPGEHGRPLLVLEAVAAGVILTTLEHSVGEADAVCVFRPKLEKAKIADAVAHAMKHHGKPYDFDFDFFSSDRLVCTELVYRAYQGPIRFELKTIMGRETLPALEILEKWVRERASDGAELDLVCFLDAVENEGVARQADEEALLQTRARPGMTILRADVKDAIWPRVGVLVLLGFFLLGLLFLRKRP